MDESTEKNVFLIIADISGYTRFMVEHRLCLVHGQIIISELTKAIIKQVEIPLEISKLEGDAVFLYAVADDPNSREDLSGQIGGKLRRFLEAFSDKLQELSQSNICTCEACQNMGLLNLKIVVHYGRALLYQLGQFQELAGVDVIIVHRLLKNSVPAKQYILMTEAAFRGLQAALDFPMTPGVETYDEIGPVKTMVYLPEAAPEGREAQPRPPYGSFYYRAKNEISKSLRTALAYRGLLKFPKFNHLQAESNQEPEARA